MVHLALVAGKAVFLGCLSAIAIAAACSASGGGSNPSSGGSGGSAGSGAGGGSGGSGATGIDAGSDAFNSDAACAATTFQAEQSPVAMMIVLDRSSSMTTNGKWAAAQQAIVQAIDQNALDNIALGLLAYPAFQVAAPQCISILVPQVTCGVSSLPDVPIANAGTDKSNASSGVRKDIYTWLTSHSPDSTATDASPGYDAMNAAIQALQGYSINGKRLMLFITDGGFSCASTTGGARGGYSDGLCPDWEFPDNVVKLISKAYVDPAKPVSTFIVGVPGSDSHGQNQGPYATAPYSMRLALSAYAYAGSPTTVPSNCDGTAFTKTGGDPGTPCHFDMTQGTFDAAALAGIIGQISGTALGCTFALPQPEAGTVDKNKINVQLTTNGQPAEVKQAPGGCGNLDGWYYDGDNIQLCPTTCTTAKAAADAKVDILVGCETKIR